MKTAITLEFQVYRIVLAFLGEKKGGCLVLLKGTDYVVLWEPTKE